MGWYPGKNLAAHLGNFADGVSDFVGSVTDGVSDFVGSVTKGVGGFWDDLTGQTAVKKAVRSQRRGAKAALGQQQAALGQQMAMFREQQAMLQPFMDQTQQVMNQMGVLAGTQGADAQQQAIDAIQNSPMFQAQLQQGQNAILQNASATGGLRGGNVQGALAQFNPAMLQSTIQQQMNNLGGIAGTGMNAVGMASGGYGNMMGAQGQAGMNMANIQNQMGQQRAALQLAQYQMPRDFLFDLFGLGLQGAQAGAML